ncbi:hypothetical protein F4778DRAFT_255514 [Xylariomycetidae sp. FL2044]|nr:hypothetical protein F4778DRAFT_255514 [Xylariomycetidae sp. FL2044]
MTRLIRLTVDSDIYSQRLVAMRYRAMIMDNYVEAGGDLSTLRYLGVSGVVNEDARNSIMEMFANRKLNPNWPLREVFYPGSVGYDKCLEQNVFVRGVERLVTDYHQELGGATIKQVTFVSDGWVRVLREPRLHIVVELERKALGLGCCQEDE